MKAIIDRRNFLKSAMATSLLASLIPSTILANDDVTITILHTNDTHSQIEPFGPGTRNEGMGGVARRATFIKQVKRDNPNTLMVDAGDMFQGTPFFNFYHGELEVKTLSAAGYDVVTLGNHDFDEGVDSLVKALNYAKFEIVSANYDFGTTALKNIVKPYVIRQFAGIKVALFGMGIDFQGLVIDKLHQGVTWQNPIKVVPPLVEKLKNEEKADLIIGISHLGYRYDKEPEQPSDLKVAEAAPEIDFIVGGHTHTFMKEPYIVKHANGRETILFQVGYAGINVGRVDFKFSNRKLVSWQSAVHNVDGQLISKIWHKESFV